MTLNEFALPARCCSLPSRGVNALAKSLLFAVALGALVVSYQVSGAEEGLTASPAPAATNNSDNETQLLRNFLLLQDQLRATQRAVEQAREQAQSDARRAEELMAARLNLIEQTLNAQRVQEISALQQSTRTVIVAAGSITVLGLLAVVFAGFAQVRAMTRLADVSRQLRDALPALTAGDPASPALLLGRESVANANGTLLTAIDRLQKRLEDMEASVSSTHTGTNGHHQIAAPVTTSSQVTPLLAKGQALLNMEKPDEALDQFDEALRVEPRNIEAWIKKGTALERLQRVDEAIVAYDQAIAVDGSTATAYLFKAGVYNRQKKYAEALQCYEKALSAQQKTRTQTARA
jgi:tetratricopeptide (TPR) repeat protein